MKYDQHSLVLSFVFMITVFIVSPHQAFAGTCNASCADEAILYAGISKAVYDVQDYTRDGVTWTEVESRNWGAGCTEAEQIFGSCIFSGFHATLYTNQKNGDDERFILAFRGTDGIVDGLSADIGFALGTTDFQLTQAQRITSEYKAKYGYKLTLTGHSLGGGLSIIAAQNNDLPAYAFNPAPMPKVGGILSTIDIKIYRLRNFDGSKKEFIWQNYDPIMHWLSDFFKRSYYNYYSSYPNVYDIIAPDHPQWNELGPMKLHKIANMQHALIITKFSLNESPEEPQTREINQFPTETTPGGDTFSQKAIGFTPNATGTLYYQPKGTNDSQYPHSQDFTFDNTGYKEFVYQPSVDKPYGTYEWWIKDHATGYVTTPLSYHIVQPDNSAYSFGFEASEKTPTDSPPPECLPDFVAKRAWITKSEHGNDKYIFEPGDTPWIHVKVKNEGCADSPQDIQVWYFLSGGEHEDSHSEWEKIATDKIRKNELHVGQDKTEKDEFEVPSEPGVYNIVACADRIRSHHNGHGDVLEEHKSNDCSTEAVFTVFPKNHDPVGNFDNATCDNLTGWANDPDTTSGISVFFYADGSSGNGTLIGSTLTNNNQFSFLLPESLHDGQSHQIYAYSVDSLNGKEILLGGSPKTINCSNPVHPDLIVQSPRVDGATWANLNPDQLFTVSATVENQGNTSSVSTTLRYYLSTNSTIDTSDSEIGTNTVDSLTAGGTSPEDNANRAAPSTPGSYYVGACVDQVSGESNTDNNCSSGVPISVNSPPYIPRTPNPSNGALDLPVQTPLDFLGGDPNQEFGDPVTYDVYLEANDSTPDNIVCNDAPVSICNPSGGLSYNTTYFWKVIAQDSHGLTKTGPVWSFTTVNNSTLPDLIVQSPSVSDTTLTPGQSFTVYTTVKNQGSGSSSSTTLRYYRSTNSTINTGDTLLGTDSVSSLSPNGTSPENISFTAPSSSGTYWIGACVDSVSGESNTGNNCSIGVQIAVSNIEPENTNIVPILQLLLSHPNTIEFNGLEWQDINSSQVLKLNWTDSLLYCSNLQLSGKDDWRLPNIDELREAYQLASQPLAIIPTGWIWSSSEFAEDPLRAYFIYGNNSIFWAIGYKGQTAKAHCVRDMN